MKLFHGIAVTFLLSIICAISGVEAGAFQAFNNIEISGLGGTYTTPEQYSKTLTTKQYYYTTEMEKAVKARTYAMYGNDGYSAWADAVKEGNVYWSGNTNINDYKFQVKAKSYNIASFGYWGIWYYNWPQ